MDKHTSTYLRRLAEADRGSVAALIARDPVMGSLVQSFVARRGLEGDQQFWGVWDDDTLAGLATYDLAGRSTILGCARRHAGLLAEFYARCKMTDAGLSFVDAETALADDLAVLLPPCCTESLGMWVWQPKDAIHSQTVSDPAELSIRTVDPDRDVAGLETLYLADSTFRALGVNVPETLSSVKLGQRLMLVGEVPDEAARSTIVTAAFAWLTDDRVARLAGVVTHPEWRGRGYATCVVRRLTHEVAGSGRQPYLYVDLANASAMAVYAKLGYQKHAVVTKLRYGERRY